MTTMAMLRSPPARASSRCSACRSRTRTICTAHCTPHFACRKACIAILRSLKSRDRRPSRHVSEYTLVRLVVRSIHTAEGSGEYVPVGRSIRLAARMQALAPPGSIAVTEATRNLCEGYFNFRSVGQTKVKGVSETIELYEVVWPRAAAHAAPALGNRRTDPAHRA